MIVLLIVDNLALSVYFVLFVILAFTRNFAIYWYCKTCVKWPLKNRQNKDRYDKKVA